MSCSLFAALASDPATFLPYSREIADQRRKYGESLLRKADEHLSVQEAYEQEVQQKLDAARQRRMDEKERVDQLEVTRNLVSLNPSTDVDASGNERVSFKLRQRRLPKSGGSLVRRLWPGAMP